MTQSDPELYRYVDVDGFCLSARLLIDLNTGAVTETLSITIEGSDEPQSIHVRASEAPTVTAGILRAAGQQPAVLPAPDQQTAELVARAVRACAEHLRDRYADTWTADAARSLDLNAARIERGESTTLLRRLTGEAQQDPAQDGEALKPYLTPSGNVRVDHLLRRSGQPDTD